MIKEVSSNIILIIISLCATSFIMIRQFVLNNVPEYFPWGYEFGEIIYNLSIGYIVTYWFYFLTVYRREKKYKAKAYKLVHKRARNIVISFYALKQSIINANKPILDEIGITMDNGYNYGQILRFVNPSQDSGSLDGAFQPMNWSTRITRVGNSIEKAIKDIFIVIPYIDSEDIELFSEIYSCSYLEIVNNIDLSGLAELGFLGQDMFEFNSLIEKIEEKFVKKSIPLITTNNAQ